ncbi:MBOAT family O-acyltransferase [uncultured Rikenella sp.]|uniref:MBOAT family O-acyltransferase n=1 Tax=uncultured Rikenella sp. TaxID=368003 RepID=UPI0026030E6D|nr:MBOAT family O-acyltransferase [uncultured Rikenella sp.]
MAIQLSNLIELLKYNPEEPLLFTSGLFLFLFLGFTFFYGFMRRTTTLRIVYVTLFSLYFYYKTSGLFFLLLIFTATSDFLIGRSISRSVSRRAKRWWVALSVCLNLGMLGYFKYTDFLIEIFNRFLADPWEFQNIFLPIGISFFTFQSMSYIIDLYRGKVEPLHRWIDYLFYISFFPQLVAGPIVRARDFIPQIRQRPLVVSRAQFGEGFWLILCGLFKKAVISDFISLNFVDRIFDNPMLYTGLENLMGVLGYALQIYCDFSGYSDMAIGIALLLGFRFNANFDSPYKSATITEFWRRWHISLSSWLKDYLYISLGGNRKGRFRTYLNLMITMLLGGLWHGAAMRFIVWGGLHGTGLAVHKWTMHHFRSFKPTGAGMPRWRRVMGIAVTFSFVCATWVFFRSPSMEVAGQVFSQIFTAFHPEIFFDFVTGYRWVVLLMATGYLLHFASARIEARTMQIVQRLPIVLYAAMLTGLIWLIMQMRNGDVQPFIYFQF